MSWIGDQWDKAVTWVFDPVFEVVYTTIGEGAANSHATHIDNPHIYKMANESVMNAMKAVCDGAIAGTVNLIVGTCILMIAIYYTVYGYMLISGGIQNPMGDFVKSGIKFILISYFALNADVYGEYVASSVFNLASGIASAWSGSMGTPVDILDNGLTAVLNAGNNVSYAGSELGVTEVADKLMMYLAGFAIMVAGILVTLPAGAIIICSNAMLMILVGIGPLFIASLMFPVISDWFSKWFANVMTQIFTIAITTMVGVIGVQIVAAHAPAFKEVDVINYIGATVTIVGLSAMMLWITYRASNLAGGLAGGVSSSAITLGAMAGAALGMGGAVASLGKGAISAGKAANSMRDGFKKRGSDKTDTDGQKFANKLGRGARSLGEHGQHAYQAMAARMRSNSVSRA